GDPFFLAPDRFRIVAARDTDADGVGEPGSWLEQIGAAPVDLGVLPVPEDVAAVIVQRDDALPQGLDGPAPPLLGFARLCKRCFRLGARALDLVVIGAFDPTLEHRRRLGPGGTAEDPARQRRRPFLVSCRPGRRHKTLEIASRVPY